MRMHRGWSAQESNPEPLELSGQRSTRSIRPSMLPITRHSGDRNPSASNPVKSDVHSITPDELARRIKNGSAPFMLDVREPEEMADGVIPGSINIPMAEVEQRLRELPADRDIVVICHLGQRSEHIATRLNALGFDRALNLDGGMDAWLEHNRRGQLSREPNLP